MAIEIISSEGIWLRYGKNKQYQRWPTRQKPERLSPIATPITKATFKIQPHEKIFCIGSCFALEISKALHRQNFNVLSLFNDLPKSPNRAHFDENMFTKYNVASIYNELTWALNPNTPYQHDYALISTKEGEWQDYQLKGANYSDDEEIAKLFRDAFNNAFKKIKEVDVVVITLGLSEVWFDKQTQLYLNVSIPAEIIKHYPQRFELHVFDYAQTLYYLEAIYHLLATYLNPTFRLLITVSPVPLLATLRQQDVLVANSYSKAVLRAAVEEFVCDKSNVNYFPSYEFVTLSNPAVVWRNDDFRHVDSTFVDYIMANVMDEFTDVASNTEENNTLLKAKSLYYGHFIKEAAQLIKPLLTKKTSNKEVWSVWGMLQLRLNGRYKNLLLTSFAHFKTYRHLNLIQHIQYARHVYRARKKQTFIGHLDVWDGRYLGGWASCLDRTSPVQITILANEKKITTLPANLPRTDVAAAHGENHLNCGFRVELGTDVIGNYPLRVVFTETGLDLPGSPVFK